MNSSASATVLCIFQLPAIRAALRRPALTLSASTPGSAALEQLERGTAAGRDVRELSARPTGQGRGRVAAADDGRAGRRGHGLGDGGCPRRTLVLEDAHRPVPEDGPGGEHRLARRPRRVRGPDVERHPAVGDVDALVPARRGSAATRSASPRSVGQGSWRACFLRGGDQRRGPPRALLSPRRVPDGVARAPEERKAHRAADEDRVGELGGSASITAILSVTLAPPSTAT